MAPCVNSIGGVRMSRRGPYIPLEQRIRLHDEVLQLRRQGLSYNHIIERIHRFDGVQLNPAHISDWVRGTHTPLGNVNKFDARPTATLAYIIGVKASDGYVSKHDHDYRFELRTIDYEFAAETGRNLAWLLKPEEPYEPRWDRNKRLWCVTCCSTLLYKFLRQPWQNLKSYIEHCKNCVAAFLRGFFDGEGSIERRYLKAYNTGYELLCYVQYLLRRYFGIQTTGPHKNIKQGHRFRNPKGKLYRTKKQSYFLYIRVDSLPLFHRHVGFRIKRKQLRLIRALKG